jgi:hypothetical protein
MNHRSAARSGSAALTRSVWSLLAVLWLNMAVLPCAMAFESSDHDCPHCPPADERQMAGRHSHGDEQQMAGGHKHGDERAQLPGAKTKSQCCDLDEASIDTRTGKLKVKDSGDVEFFASPAIIESPTWCTGHVATTADPPDICGSSPPLHVLYCVYLK